MMVERTSEHRALGPTSRARELAGAGVLLVGAALLCLTTLADLPLYENLAILGGVVTLAWLVDGTGARYVGAGLVALAIGGGITIGQEVGVKNYEHSLVYALLGAALIVISWVSPKAIRGSGTFLLAIASTVAALTWVASYNAGWELAAGLGVWSALEFARIFRNDSHTQTVSAAASRQTTSARRPAEGRIPETAGRK